MKPASTPEAGAAGGAGTAPTGIDGFDESLPYRIVRTYRARFEESTASERIRPAIYLAWAADVAWQHSALLGFDRGWYSTRGLFWLVRAIRLDVFDPIRTYETALVSTQVLAYRRIAARRHTEIRDGAGNLRVSLEIDWVMTNERGIPSRVPDEFRAFVPDGATFELLRVCLPDTPLDASSTTFRVRRRELDPLDHVNNSVYLDYLEETLANSGDGELLATAPRRYEVDFLAAAGPDDTIRGVAWAMDEARAFRLTRDNGDELFRGLVSRLQTPDRP